MIARLIAVVQEIRTKPPTLFVAIVGAAVAGLGLAVVQRYHAGLIRDLTEDSVMAGVLEEQIVGYRSHRDRLAEEVDALRQRIRELTPEAYPSREDVDPLGAGTGDARTGEADL